MDERVQVGGGPLTWKDYIQVDGRIVAMRTLVETTPSTVGMEYFVTDQLGSVAVVTGGNAGDADYGKAISGGRLFYDAWGKMRAANGAADTTCNNPGAAVSATGTTRGFTGQEQMPSVCLVNYNARIYDPQLGRFMSADPSDGSGLNRYTYVNDNPLSLTDPTGYGYGGGGMFSSPVFRAFAAIAAAVVAYETLPALILSEPGIITTGQVAAAAELGNSAAEASLALTAGISGGVAGLVSTGTLKGAALGAGEALAFNQVGDFLQTESFTGSSVLGSPAADAFVSHGLVGGLISVAGGGNFASGFLAAGFGSTVQAPGATGWGSLAAGTAESAVLGGTGSVLGGGKFANGAATGAFAYAVAPQGQSGEGDIDGQSSPLPSVGSGLGGIADIFGKIWALPNTIIGLTAGLSGYGLSEIFYALGWQAYPPDILFRHNAIEFTYNSAAFLGGAITFGNAEIFSAAETSEYGPAYDLQIGWMHEWAHTIQAEILGPLYLPLAAASLATGEILNGNSHGPASFMEQGPMMNPPQPWIQ